jgi:hypothetical protein
MKPIYLFITFFSLFITFLADGIQMGIAGLGATPGVVPVIGTFIAGVTIPVGILFGLAIGTCINITMGAGFIILLLWNGLAYPQYLLPGVVAEMIPGINDLPFWFGIALLCMLKQYSEENAGLLATTARVVANGAAAVESPVGALKLARSVASPSVNGDIKHAQTA